LSNPFGEQLVVQPAETGPSSTVLIVDDSPVVTRALSTILRQEGYQTAVCHTGAEALGYAQSNAPANAAVVDIHLPDLSGLILTSKLRQHLGPDRPIIILSGDTSMENIRSLPHVGATYFISKPFNPSHLIQRLRELVVRPG
jgi:two-component system response regulator MtrA